MKIRTGSRYAMLALVIALMMVMMTPVAAITNGDLDNDDHPHVVLLVADVGDEDGWRCSATLLSPTVVLTAGHCVSNYPYAEKVDAMRIFPASDVQAGIDAGTSHYPGPGPDSIEAADWYAHPLYETAPFFVHDVGIVILEEPLLLSEYGALPEVADSLDALKTKRGKNKTFFTAVGYGLQRINPVFLEADRVRMVAYPKLIQINTPGFTGDFSLLLSNNHATGGTCFGDSGGPNFLRDTTTVAGVTSFGLNGNCAGTGGVFRMDRQDVLDFVNSYLP